MPFDRPSSLAFVSDGGHDDLELKDYLAILRRRWAWVALPPILFAAAGYLLAVRAADTYEATAEVLLGDTAAQEAVGGGSQSISYRDRLLENELSLARSDRAHRLVAERFDLEVDDIPVAEIIASDASDLLIFTASEVEPLTAADTANAWAETYVALKQADAQASIGAAIEQLDARLDDLQQQRNDVRADLIELEAALVRANEEDKAQAQLRVDQEASQISGDVALIDAQIAAVIDSVSDLELSGELALSGTARVVTRANVPTAPVNAPPARNVALGAGLGLVVGGALALVRHNLDRAVRTSTDIEELGLDHLGSVPRAKRRRNDAWLATVADQDGAEAEAAQKLQSSLRFVVAGESIRSILVTSADQGDGKTTTAANVSVAMARTGLRTLLIDADLRRPRLHKVFEIAQSPGLTSVVLDGDALDEAAHTAATITDSLVVMPAGELPPHPASFIGTPRFSRAIEGLQAEADLTVIDAAPMLPVADTHALVPTVGGVVLVVRHGETTKDQLAETAAAVRRSGGRVLGCILVGVKLGKSAYSYRYGSDEKRLERMDPARALEVTSSETDETALV